jgi:hypothetical protein
MKRAGIVQIVRELSSPHGGVHAPAPSAVLPIWRPKPIAL